MRHTHTLRALMAASLSLGLLAGCASLPTAGLGALATRPVSGTAFVSASALTNSLSSTTKVTTAAQARALSVYDEHVVEGASALLEKSEAAANYKVAAITDPTTLAELEAAFRNAGNRSQESGDRQAPPEGGRGMGPAGGPQDRQAPPDGMGPEGEGGHMGPPPQGDRRGGFEFGRFGGGAIDDQEHGCPKLEHHAQPPARKAQFGQEDRGRMQKRRQAGQEKQADFAQANPKAGDDEAMIRQVLDGQPWLGSEDDGDTVYKQGTMTMTLANGVSRKIVVLRVIEAQAPHALVQAQTDIQDVDADGGSHTVHWEKALQDDGSYSIAYHQEVTTAAGVKWVADWTKTLNADGTYEGSGTFTQFDAQGVAVAKEALTIGGDDANGQTISEDVADVPDDTTATESADASEASAETSDTEL